MVQVICWFLARRSKWHDEQENIKESDIVYFKIKDSPLHSSWLTGKVEYVVPSRDNRTRTVGIGYKYKLEKGERIFKTVERPVREIVKLLNIDDTSLLDDIKSVQNHARKLFDTQKIVSTDEVDNAAISSSGTFDPYKAFIAYTSREVPVKRELLFVADNFAYMMNPINAASMENFDDEVDAEWPFDSPVDDANKKNFLLTLI